MRFLLLLACVALQAAFSSCNRDTAAANEHGVCYDYNARRIYLYAVQATDSAGQLMFSDTLGLLCTGKPSKHNPGQNIMSWLYMATMKGQLTLNPVVVNNTYTGLISSKEEIFLHPPREEDRYTILEICPFPYLRFPLTKGKTWTFHLEVGAHYSNHFVQWSGNEMFHSSYTVLGDTTVYIPAGKLRCNHIYATTLSRFAASTADFYFNDNDGLVKLLYKPLDKSTIDITFIRNFHDEALFATKRLNEPTNTPFTTIPIPNH